MLKEALKYVGKRLRVAKEWGKPPREGKEELLKTQAVIP